MLRGNVVSIDSFIWAVYEWIPYENHTFILKRSTF